MRKAVVAVAASLLCAACAAPPRAPGPGAPPDLTMLRTWTATGRLALAVDGEGGNGTFVWSQRDGVSELDLRGPFGAGALRIVATPGTWSVVDGDGRGLDPEAARARVNERLGAEVPWNQLRYWLLGVPSPDEPARIEESGATHARAIDQSGWRIGYESFQATPAGALPRRFDASRESVRVRVIVDRWTVPPAGGDPR